MASARSLGLFCVLAQLSAGTHAESERCVPAETGGWHCGVDVQITDAAPLPEPETRSAPPIMLIDPARFGEGDLEDDMTAPDIEASAGEPESNLPVAQPTVRAASTSQDGFVVQLARAESPRGFDALLAKIGPAARNSQRRQLRDGSWVLLLGHFDAMASARNAIPSDISGAFARALNDYQFN
jgi:hypothetical protein